MPNPVENIVAKGAAKAAAVGARAKGLTGVFNKLAEQHKEAAILLQRAGSTDDLAKRQDLWMTLRRELLSHERGEASVVYPALAGHAATRSIAQQHDAEVPTLEATIAEIDVVGCESRDWASLIARLTKLIEHHADEEENEFFPRAIEALGKDAAAALEGPFMDAKKRAMEGLA
jgi:hemerythrin HHE cation binding domain-containing protein